VCFVRVGSGGAHLGDRPLSPLVVVPTFFFASANMLAFMGIGQWELIIILVVIFILFGHRLPSVMRSLGRGVVEFKEGMAGIPEKDEAGKEEHKEV
jgi:sec-independent protein translocase protein TatA